MNDDFDFTNSIVPTSPPPIEHKEKQRRIDYYDEDDEPVDEGVVASDYFRDKDYRVKELYYKGYCYPLPLKERFAYNRVLKLWKELYPGNEIQRISSYKDTRYPPYYVIYRVIDKETNKVVVPKATLNGLAQAVIDEYYDYDNY